MKASRARSIALLLGLSVAVPCVAALAQDQPGSPPQQPPNSGAENSGGAQPQGEEIPVLPRTPQNDRTPVSGVEDYRLDGINLGRNFLVGQVQLNEIYDTNSNSGTSSSAAQNDSITNLRGLLSLQWLSRRTALNLDYHPALLVYDRGTLGTSVIQQFNVTEKFYVHRWTLLLGNDFTFLPQSAAGLGGYGLGGVGNPGIPGLGGGLTNFNPFFVPGQSIQTLGDRISNALVGQAQYTFGPRSSVNLSGTYGLLHFFESGLVNSRDLSFHFGYDYLISPKNTFTVAYTHTQLSFSAGRPGFSNQSVVVAYRRYITGKMSLILEGGPQFSHFNSSLSGPTTRLSLLVRSVLRYQSIRNGVDITYQHRVTAGSGLLVGADTDLVNAMFMRVLSRNWTAATSALFSHNSSLSQTTGANLNVHFNTWRGDLTAHRKLGQSLDLEIRYDISRQTSNVTSCINNISCGAVHLRHQIGLGLIWNSRPYSID